MQIIKISLTQPKIYTQINPISFKQMPKIKSFLPADIGSCAEGLIGKVRVRKADNTECYLNVYKKMLYGSNENYSIKNENGDILGEIILAVKKYTNYDKLNSGKDPSHVFVSTLMNYSNPKTPYYNKQLECFKDVGTRLMQIALKRSQESNCNGQIKLVAKNESKPWYQNVIRMTEEFPDSVDYGYKFNIHNPNSMILPVYSQEYLSALKGGLYA